MATTWTSMTEERDSDGKLTKLAQALDAIEGNGCDCGTDEPGTCLACLCEEALHEQFDELARLRGEASRTVYVPKFSDGTTGNDCIAVALDRCWKGSAKAADEGFGVYAITLTARKVQP